MQREVKAMCDTFVVWHFVSTDDYDVPIESENPESNVHVLLWPWILFLVAARKFPNPVYV